MTERLSTTPPSRAAARLAIVAVVMYQLILLALIFIRRDLDPSWHTISEWAIGRHGWIMSTAFLISAVSYTALFVVLRSQARGAIGRIGLGILAYCAIGTALTGAFTTDPLDTPPDAATTTGVLHYLFSFTSLNLLPIAALLINLSLARNQRWRPARQVLLWSAGAPLLGLIGFWAYLAIFVFPLDADYGPGVNTGWPNRILLMTYMAWIITLAWQATQLPTRTAVASSAVASST